MKDTQNYLRLGVDKTPKPWYNNYRNQERGIDTMKKLVNLRCYAAVGKNDFCDTSIWNHIRYVEVAETNSTEYTLETFEQAFAAVADNHIRNAETSTTFFGNRPTIEMKWGDIYKPTTVLTAKTFKPVRVKWMWEEVERMYTMKDLADLLPAEQFCEWLKDHGITMVGSH